MFPISDPSPFGRRMTAVMVAGTLLSVFAPKTGEFALLNVLGGCLLLGSVCIYFVTGLIRDWKTSATKKRIKSVILAVLLLYPSTSLTTELLLDTAMGSQIIYLENCDLSRSSGRKNRHPRYTICGYDEDGEYRRIRISREDYYDLEGDYRQLDEGITLEVYLYTGRAVWIL